MKWHVLDAVFKRNFTAYFTNPTGYVFICVFVVLGSLAAFWPPEFFNANLANLDQLNRYLPYILMIFVPAITMSAWADERRQGTDELLLTIPASDWEVVFGKYLAAVGIFTVALLFSCVCNLLILLRWGTPDAGLFLANYLGYWFTGLAMLAIGMVASFLTSNLTVGFILGVLFNAPLVLPILNGTSWGPLAVVRFLLVRLLGQDRGSEVAANAPQLLERARWWTIEEQFSDFGRGVVGLPAIAYFTGIAAVCLYLSMVLIGRRHWAGRRDGGMPGLHYLARVAGLVAAVAGVVLLLQSLDRRFGLRADLTEERISSLSPDTRRLLAGIDARRPIEIKAYVSPTVPEDYAQVRLNLLNTLRQFERLGRGAIRVEIVSTEPKTEAAVLAAQQFGIEPQTVLARVRGAYREEEIFLGCGFTSGLEKVVVPFFDRGTPVEYELIRSVCTVAQQKRKRLGVLATDVEMFGGFDMMTGQPRPRQPILEELEKQYDVVSVDASAPITESYDVLLAVQPSTLGPEQMANFVAAVAAGQPVAVFEDPLPVLMTDVPGTGQPRRSPMGPMAMFGPQSQPKGDLDLLWRTLGVRLVSKAAPLGGTGASPYVVCQDHNPHLKLQLPAEFVFIDSSLAARDAKEVVPGFNQEDRITAGLQEVLFPFPGDLEREAVADLTFTPLVRTAAPRTGTIEVDRVMANRGDMAQLRVFERKADKSAVLAVLVERAAMPVSTEGASAAAAADGTQGDAAAEPAPAPAAPAAPAAKPIRAVVVADIDLLDGRIFGLRARPDEVFGLDFDNVEFALNVLDDLAGDQRFIDVRKRKPRHRTLERIEDAVAESRTKTDQERMRFIADFEEEEQKANAELEQQVGEFEQKIRDMEAQGDVDPQAAMQAIQQLASRKRLAERRLNTKLQALKRNRDSRIEAAERELEGRIREEQDKQKWLAVLLPPIPPLLVAFFVFFQRRAQEREGVSRSRLR